MKFYYQKGLFKKDIIKGRGSMLSLLKETMRCLSHKQYGLRYLNSNFSLSFKKEKVFAKGAVWFLTGGLLNVWCIDYKDDGKWPKENARFFLLMNKVIKQHFLQQLNSKI